MRRYSPQEIARTKAPPEAGDLAVHNTAVSDQAAATRQAKPHKPEAEERERAGLRNREDRIDRLSRPRQQISEFKWRCTRTSQREEARTRNGYGAAFLEITENDIVKARAEKNRIVERN